MKKYSNELKILAGSGGVNKSSSCRKGSILGEKLQNETSFLSKNTKINERLWYVDNDIFEIVYCPVCKINKAKYNNRLKTLTPCSYTCNINEIDEITGLKKRQLISKKSTKGRSNIDPETGLTGHQKAGINIKKTMSKIDSTTGSSGYKIAAIKASKTMSKIDPETGLSIYDKNMIHRKILSRTSFFNNILNNVPIEYNIITTLEEFINDTSRRIKYSHNCKNVITSNWPSIRCTKCYPYNKSIAENEILEFCKSLISNAISNNRSIIKPLELDIYLPDNKLSIEYNGLFWHSSNSVESEYKKYHLYKTEECEKQGIQLFHIFENEWQNPIKQNIWKSIISNRLGQSERIYARKTKIRLVTSKDKSSFLNSNHLQGNCNSSVNFGLYLENKLVSLMTFGISRYNKKIDWELLRFCNKIGYSVVGGASRLLKAFQNTHAGSIISYADRRRSNGNLYNQLGFKFSHNSGPNYWYYKDSMNLESRLAYQKHKLRDKLEIFDPKLTESENMYNNGYRKIYDCGNQVWVLT